MTRLVEALRALGLPGEVALSGRWLTLDGARCRVYVAEAPRGHGFFTWCDDPAERAVEYHPDPTAAILAGLRRADRNRPGPGSDGAGPPATDDGVR